MIARVTILLPFVIHVRVGDVFSPRTFRYGEYEVRIFPPLRSSGVLGQPTATPRTIDFPRAADPQPASGDVTIDGAPSVPADLLQVDFIKPQFDRTEQGNDPPSEAIFRVANLFLQQLRTLTRASQVKPLEVTGTTWGIAYLDDHGAVVPPDPPHKSRRMAALFKVSGVIAFKQDVWTALQALPADYESTTWDALLLDAVAILPEIGPAIVLANTAIEVRISTALDHLASTGRIDPTLWDWLNDRDGDYRKEPSMTERLDVLLRVLGGRSLKEDAKLWKSYRDLRDARNAFAHQGKAMLDKGRTPVSSARAAQLVQEAQTIIDWIESLLPESERRPQLNTYTTITTNETLGVVGNIANAAR